MNKKQGAELVKYNGRNENKFYMISLFYNFLG